MIITCRHLQADRWKIVSAADDKTLKVSFCTDCHNLCDYSVKSLLVLLQ